MSTNSKFQVLSMSQQGINDALQVSLENSRDVEDYSFEERYCKGVRRVVRPKQDELDRLHFTRLESIFTRSDWEVFSVFLHNCRAHPRKVATVWLDDEGREEVRWTYNDLYSKSRSVAHHLIENCGLKRGDRVLLVYEPCIEFFPAFWACIGLGIVAVPVCPPDPFSPDSDFTEKLHSIIQDCNPRLILTSRKYKDTVAAARTFLGKSFDEIMNRLGNVLDFSKYLWVPTDDVPAVPLDVFDFQLPADAGICERDVAFLQYTSGSTGGAKGVVVQHRTLAANCMNCALLTQGMGSIYVYQFSLGISWLPTFHDMGLIGFHVAPMLIGGTMVYFSPINFIQNPVLWLKVMSKYRHISTGGPPFALDLCVRRVTPTDLEQIDLSGLEILILGAEPIRASYMLDFTRKFASYGFNPKAYMTCFGMAENVLHVAGKWSNQYEPRMILVDSKMLNNNSELVIYKDEKCSTTNAGEKWPASNPTVIHQIPQGESVDSQWLVSSGELVTFSSRVTVDEEDHLDLKKRIPHFYRKEVSSFLTIVNPDTCEEVPEGCVGEIWICGPSKTNGYWNKEEINQKNFRAVLKGCARNDTMRLIQWAKSGQYKSNKDSHNQFDYALFSPDEIKQATTPLIGLLRNCINEHGDVEWLRSGDMGVIYDGDIFVTGRIKDMIIIRGVNYYADDIEHCVSAGKAGKLDIDVGNDIKNRKNDGLSKALSYLRPGSAVAYSITISADGSDNSDAKKFNAEGEHLALIVELQADDVLEDSDSELDLEYDDEEGINDDDDDDDDEDGDDDSDNSDTGYGNKKKPGKNKTGKHHSASAKGRTSPSLAQRNSIMQSSNKIRQQKHKKFGNQAPLWQRFLMKYGGNVIYGLGNAYEHEEKALLEKITGVSRQGSRENCTDKVKSYIQNSFIKAIRQGIDASQSVYKYVYGIQDDDEIKNIPKRRGITASLIDDSESSEDESDYSKGDHDSHDDDSSDDDSSSKKNKKNNHKSPSTKKNNKKTTKKTSKKSTKSTKTTKSTKSTKSKNKKNSHGDSDSDSEGEDFDLEDESLKHRPTDRDTNKMIEKYSRKDLEEIASAIRRSITTKFLLVVGKITFLSPKSIKKTSSGKKRRSEMIAAIHTGYLDHRIVHTSYSRALEKYAKTTASGQTKGGLGTIIKKQDGKNTKSTTSKPTDSITKNKVGSGKSHFSTFAKPASANIREMNKKDEKIGELMRTDTFGKYSGVISKSAVVRDNGILKYSKEMLDMAAELNHLPGSSSSSSSSSKSTHGKSDNKPVGTAAQNRYHKDSKEKHLRDNYNTNTTTSTTSYGGTVGVSLDGKHDAYEVKPRRNEENVVSKSRRETAAYNSNNGSSKVDLSTLQKIHDGNYTPFELLPPRESGSDNVEKKHSLEESYELLQKCKEKAAKLTFDEAKTRILHVVVDELRDIVALPTAEGDDSDAAHLVENLQNEEITVEFLQEMSTRPADDQEASLQAYGLDSMTGFKLAKSLATEFQIPPNLMGPHLFLQDPTIDGMVRVMVQLVKLQAHNMEEEYNKLVNAKNGGNKVEGGDSSFIDKETQNRATHAVYRGTLDTKRIPYILGIGVAVPHACAPQMELTQAMLPAMKMDQRSEDRFLKIAANSGVQTKYSALDSLRNVFWGKEGVNTGNDEFVDARQEVFKTESVKLSIRAAAECMDDWVQEKKMKTDDDRDLERLEKFIRVEDKHRNDLYEEEERLERAEKEKKEKKEKELKEKELKERDGDEYTEKDGKEYKEAIEADLDSTIDSTTNKSTSSSSSANTSNTSRASANPVQGDPYAKKSVLEDDFNYDLSFLAKSVSEKTRRTITHVVGVTCTGIIVPGLEFHIMQALGLPNTTQRLSIQFMGCFGAVSGIRCASALASENPNNRVLVVCCELCSIHVQLNDKIDNLIATALFADGAGAFIVGCDPTENERPLFEIGGCSSYVISGTINQMTWDMSRSGLLVGLAKEIAGEIFNHISDYIDDMLKYAPDEKFPEHRVRAEDCNLAIHPGGPLILNSIQNVLGLEMVGDGHGGGELDIDAPTYESWKILQEYGNMSSATLVFVLDRMRENRKKASKWTPTIAFGPGLSIEGALLKACF